MIPVEIPAVFAKKPTAPNFIDLEGKRFGLLTVVGYAGRTAADSHHSSWYCRCDCGVIVAPKTTNIRSGSAVSCGCIARQAISDRMKKDGHSVGEYSVEYRTWRSMLQRCSNPKIAKFYNYGGRGIKVCERWLKFENFLADMGRRPDGMSIDRIDVNRHYEPSNCRWATTIEQANNTRSNILLTFEGKTQSPKKWAEYLGIPVKRIYNRHGWGWPIELILSTKVFFSGGVTVSKINQQNG